MPKTNQCPYCEQAMQVSGMHCHACQLEVRGEFPTSRLGELPTEHQRFIELFVLAGGSLKQIAEQAGVSYPTVRSRLDKVIQNLRDSIEKSPEHTGAGGPPSDAAQVLKAI